MMQRGLLGGMRRPPPRQMPRNQPPTMMTKIRQNSPQTYPDDLKDMQLAMRLAAQIVYKNPDSSKRIMLLLTKTHRPDKALADATTMVIHAIRLKMGAMFPLKMAAPLAITVLEMIGRQALELHLLPADPVLAQRAMLATVRALADELGIPPQVLHHLMAKKAFAHAQKAHALKQPLPQRPSKKPKAAPPPDEEEPPEEPEPEEEPEGPPNPNAPPAAGEQEG